ncbi:MAG TPA: helix-turn-helix domain-containing protein [Acidimicrobiales bacterium]|nr:helix-turn-helix domain-containing protein [Acidimicrobiales bacterium]
MPVHRSDAPTSAGPAEDFATALLQLGFSHHEARAYVGLLGGEPRTGYAVAKATGVPQPKVYEALRKLVARGAAFELAGRPARFVPVPADQLLAKLEASFSDRLHLARRSAAELDSDGAGPTFEAVRRLEEWPEIEAAARAALDRSRRRVYLSARVDELRTVQREIEGAVARGVDIVALCFGKEAWEVAGVRTFTHASTDKILYRSHQARHLAVVADSAETIWALATDGHSWSGVVSDSALVVAAIKDFVRHDIDLQRVYADFGDELKRAYGPALEALEDYRQDPQPPSSERRVATGAEAAG